MYTLVLYKKDSVELVKVSFSSLKTAVFYGWYLVKNNSDVINFSVYKKDGYKNYNMLY